MTLGLLITEVIVVFCLATILLYRYGNVFIHHPIVTLSVLIAWYFSLLTIFVLPFDVSSVRFFLILFYPSLPKYQNKIFHTNL